MVPNTLDQERDIELELPKDKPYETGPYGDKVGCNCSDCVKKRIRHGDLPNYEELHRYSWGSQDSVTHTAELIKEQEELMDYLSQATLTTEENDRKLSKLAALGRDIWKETNHGK